MNHRTRKAVIIVTAIICVVYLLYRGIFTLNLSTAYATFASLLLYLAEIYGVVVVLLFFLQVWDTREPPEQSILYGRTVDVFVPTYNEDPDLLRTTLQACMRMDYPHRTFLCDDGGTDARVNDPEKGPPSRERQAKLKAICDELGATYVTRPDNRHAKAGNLNFAFEKTDGEFIIIFDADHVPEPQFITRLIGYFADEKLAFVQTPHAFYNFESFQSVYNHGKGLYWEDGQLFYKVIQPGRNRWNAAIFAGSAALFRRKALAEVGYIATETITEDMHTGLRMHSRGWKSLGISQRLIAGQAAPDVTTFHTQRLRWGEGNLSIMAHDNPLNTKGLKLGQRLCYLGSMIHWAGGVFKLAIYFTPLMMLISGVPPVNQFTWTLFCIMVLYVSASIWGVRFISNGHGSFWRNEMFTMLGFWTQVKGTMRALFMRKLSKFVVTSKRGRQSKSIWPFIRPHFYFIGLSVLALFWGWGRVIYGISVDFYKPILASCWTVFHMSLAVACIRRSLWPEDLRYSYRHTVHLPVEFTSEEDDFQKRELGCTIDLSEGGAALVVYRPVPKGFRLRLSIHGTAEALHADATVVWTRRLSKDRPEIADEIGGYRLGLRFENLAPAQFDVLNRIIMHYAVPRLYEQYYASRPAWLLRAWRAIRRGPIRRRIVPREPYRMPLHLVAPGATRFTATEDVSREAAIAVLADPLPVGTRCDFRLGTPAGELMGTAQILRQETRIYAAREYYRTVLQFTHFDEQGRVKFDDLLNPIEKRAHGEALQPVKRLLPVPMLRNSVLAGVALVPFLLVLAFTFRVVHRDDVFLRDLIAANGPGSPEEYERLELVYAATLQERHPSTDRLVLLVTALAKAGRDADMDHVMTILAGRDRKNLDLQVARANAYLNSRDYARARAEYERLFHEFQEGNLPPERKREMLIALARATFHSGDVPEASRLFQQAIQAYPNDLVLRYEYAGAMLSVHRYEDALNAYDNANPDRDGRLLLATAALLLNRTAEAERHCDIILRTNPNDVEAEMLKADVLNSRKSTVQAEAIYNRLRRINPGDPAIRSRLAFIALSSKRYDQALALFQQLYDDKTAKPEDVKGLVDAAAGASALGESHRDMALRILDLALVEWLDDAVYLGRLGWVLQRLKEFDRAVAVLEKALRRDANNPELTQQYVGALFEAGQREKALPYLEVAEKTPQTRALLAAIYLDLKRFTAAETECRAILEERPNDLAASQMLAGSLGGQGKHKEALALLRQLAIERPNDPQIPIWLAEALLASGDFAGALERFRTMLEASFDQPEIRDHYVNAAAGLKALPAEHLPLIRRIAEQGVRGDVVRPEILSRLAWLLMPHNEKALVGRLLDRAVLLHPKDPKHRVELAGCLSKVGRYRDALAMYEGVPAEMQDPFTLIALESAISNWTAAEKLCWSTLQRDPDDRKAWRWLGDVLSWKGEHTRALEWFEKLLRDKPDDAELQIRVAEVTLWSGDAGAALNKFHALLEKSFENPRLWSGFLAAVVAAPNVSEEQQAQVLRIFERSKANDAIAEKKRDDPLFLARLAHALARADLTGEADLLFARALELAPQDGTERKELAGILALAKRYKDAIGLFEGLPLEPEDRFRLVSICSAAGDFVQAKQRCEAILKDEPKDKRARRMLADILSWKGDYAEALRCLNDLIRDEPDNVDHKVRAAEVTLWSRDYPAALAAFQALSEKTLEVARVRRSYIDAVAGCMLPGANVEMRKLLTLAERSLTPTDELYGDPVVLARLGGVLSRLGEKTVASRALERALELDPKDPVVRLELGGALQTAERFEEALRVYDGSNLEGDDRYRRVEVLVALKQYARARTDCEAILRGQPDARAAKRWLADILSWKGDYAESIRRFTELVREWPDDVDLPIRLAEVTLWSGDAAKAVSLFQALPEKSLEPANVRKSYVEAGAGADPAGPVKIDPKRMLAVEERSLAARDELSTDPIHLARLGLCLFRAGRQVEANRVLDRALALQSRDVNVRLELGGALAAAGRHGDAYRMYQGLTLEGPNRFRLIELFAARGDWEASLLELRALLARHPDDADAKRRLADVLSWKKDYAESIRLFEELKKARPDDASVALRLAEVLLWSNDLPKAVAVFQSVPERVRETVAFRRGFVDAAAGLDPATLVAIDRGIVRKTAVLSLASGDPLLAEPMFLSRLGLVLHRVGEKQLAARALELAEKQPPADEAGRLELAGTLVAAGLYANAARLYEGMNLQGANRFRRLEMMAAQKDWPAALTECQRLIKADPADARARRWRADITSWKGDYAEAIRLFQELLAQEPENIELAIRLAEVQLWSKDFVKALAMFVKLPDAALSRPEMRSGFIEAASASDKLLDQAAIGRAQRVAQLTLEAGPADPVRSRVLYLSRLAWVLMKGSDEQTANRLLDAAVALKPKDPEARKELGGVLAAANRVAEAFKMYEGLTLEGDDRFRLIGLHSAARDFVRAEEECRKIVREQPGNRLGKRWLADVLSWKGAYDESLRLFHELIRQEPDNAELLVRQAEVTLWSKDAESALKLFEELLTKEFDRPRLWEGFIAAAAAAKTLTPAQRELVGKIRAEADKGAFKSAVFWSRLSWIVHREGDVEAAKAYLERALALKPTLANERREVAGVLSALKRYKEAAAYYADIPLEAEDRLRLAELHAAAEDFPAAIRQIEAYLKERPDDKKALRYLADLFSWNKQYAESLDLLARLLKAEPKDAELRLRQAEVRLWSRANDEALAGFMQMLSEGDKSPRVRDGFVDAAAGAKQLDAEAIKMVVRIAGELGDVAAKPTEADLIFLGRLALVLHRAGQSAQRDLIVQRIGKNVPTSTAARRELAGIFIAVGANRQARELYSGIELDLEDKLRLVDVDTSEKNFAAAEKLARELYEANPKDAKAARKLASALAANQKHAEAVKILRGLESTGPNDPEIATDLALAVLWSGQYDEALQRLEVLLAKGLSPRLAEGYLDAAAMVKKLDVLAQKKLVLAIFEHAGAMELSSTKQRQLAWVLRRVGEKEKAVALLNALVAASGAPEVRLELAQTLDDLGRPDEAAKHYRILLKPAGKRTP
jgi:tetratricopeptide (TPR) repeat protein/cellulose synthase/poly-beta-1,6-N-acetylglucosamine synthase-like glycosyltransferase